MGGGVGVSIHYGTLYTGCTLYVGIGQVSGVIRGIWVADGHVTQEGRYAITLYVGVHYVQACVGIGGVTRWLTQGLPGG